MRKIKRRKGCRVPLPQSPYRLDFRRVVTGGNYRVGDVLSMTTGEGEQLVRVVEVTPGGARVVPHGGDR